MLSQDIPHIFALTLFEDYVYWTDWETKSINRAHKTTGTNKTLLTSTLHRPMDLHVFHALRQPDGERLRARSRGRLSLAPGAPAGGWGPAGLAASRPFSSIASDVLARHWEVRAAVDRPWSGSQKLQPSPGPAPESHSSKPLRVQTVEAGPQRQAGCSQGQAQGRQPTRLQGWPDSGTSRRVLSRLWLQPDRKSVV